MAQPMENEETKIERIYMLDRSQVTCVKLGHGAMLSPSKIYKIGEKYLAYEKLQGKRDVNFKITEAQAASLILANKAVNIVSKPGKKGWFAADIFGNILEDGMDIVEIKHDPLCDDPIENDEEVEIDE